MICEISRQTLASVLLYFVSVWKTEFEELAELSQKRIREFSYEKIREFLIKFLGLDQCVIVIIDPQSNSSILSSEEVGWLVEVFFNLKLIEVFVRLFFFLGTQTNR